MLPKSRTTLKLIVVVFVLAIAAVPSLPHYASRAWPWDSLPDVPTIEQLQALQQNGLTLPGWNTQDQQVIEVNGKKWSAQAIDSSRLHQSAVLLLRPQTWQRDQPQVEWTDINGLQRWTIDSQQRLQFTVASPSRTIATRFLRGWSEQQTYAVLQWYAWSTGGDPAPAHWFWADQQQQWQKRDRMPWVAVCVLIPIPPLSEIEPIKPLAIELGQTIQTALMTSALRS